MDVWKAHPGMQEDALRRWEFEVFLGGAAGPGKTDVLLMKPLYNIGFSTFKGIIFRRTFPELEEIIERSQRWYPSYGAEYREGKRRWQFPSGAVIKFSHLENERDKYKHQTAQYQYEAFDESTQFTPTQYLYLFSRLRTTDPRISVQVYAASNPGGISHQFFKERFGIGLWESNKTIYDPKTGLSRIFIPGLLDDNPTLMLADPAYLSRLEQLPEIEKMRLRYGIWDAFEGQVFSEINRKIHGCDDFDIPPEWEKFRTFDWGYSAPFSVGWWAVDFDGVLYRYREWYGAKDDGSGTYAGLKMSDPEIARGIKKIEEEANEYGHVRPGPADPSIWSPRRNKNGVLGPSAAEEMSKNGVTWIKADNDRIGGKRQVHTRFRVDEEGRPRILVFNSCTHWWRTFPLLREDPRNPEDVETKKQEDHIYDETRYACMYKSMRPRPIVQADKGSFQYERRKYIKAKQYAMRHGLSLAAAYGKM